jgi:hypothetical protein
MTVHSTRDYIAGALVALIGGGAFVQARQYDIGNLDAMGPGFFPAALGVALILLGAAIALVARGTTAPEDHEAVAAPEWRGWLCIAGSIAVFILMAERFGIAPTAFVSVLIAAYGDRTVTLRSAFLLAVGVSAAGTMIFGYGLHSQLPMLSW